MLAKSTALLPSQTRSKTFKKAAINNDENISAAMITKLLIALCLVATTVIIHAGGLGMILSHVLHSTERPDTRFWPITWLLIRIAWLLIVIHLFEIVVWGLFFWWQKCLPDAESAFYFSGVTYATIGYGDIVLLKEWRLFGPIEGLTGILMCGLSTAFFFVIVSKKILQRMDDKDKSELS
jgi:Ion channel